MKILTTKKIILVGGGIGGTATALALYRAGFEPIVYERTATLREVGAGVALWANATHVLKELGVLDDVLRQSDPITNYQFFSQMGKELMNLCINHFEIPAIAIHRADLQALKLIMLVTMSNKSFGSYLSLSKKRFTLSCDTFPNISANLQYSPCFGSDSRNSVYCSKLHCAVEGLLISLIARYLYVDDTRLSMHYFITLSRRKS